MACGICNNGVARTKFDIFDVAEADLTKSVQTCNICAILISILKQRGFDFEKDQLRISNDDNDHSSRCTNGIHVLISKNGQGYTTDMFSVRGLKGEWPQHGELAPLVDRKLRS